jgi:hypothetical protein
MGGSPTAPVYYLAHAVVIAAGVALTLLHNTVTTAIGTSLIATGAAGVVIYLYVARTDRTRDAIDMITSFGLAHIYERRAAQIRSEYAIRLDKARSNIDIIGFGLKDFRRDYMNQLSALSARTKVRIVIINPRSPACSWRDREEKQREGTIREEVEDFLTQFTQLYSSRETPALSLRLYTCLPLVNIFRIDDEIFWGPYLVGQASGNTMTLRVQRGILYDQLMEHFEDVWKNYSISITEFDAHSVHYSTVTDPSRPDGSR